MKSSVQSTAYWLLLSISIAIREPDTALAFVFDPSLYLPSRKSSFRTIIISDHDHASRYSVRQCRRRQSILAAAESNNNDNVKKSVDNQSYIDAVVEEKTAGLAEVDEENTSARIRKRDIFKKALQDLASLSLVDYKWRSAVFKKAEADRLEEEYVSKMMGEDPSYARPMDADDTRRGPLGNAEKSAVQWLTRVIEEEGERARLIASSEGELVRPKDLPTTGPLSELERRALQLLNEITDSEVERVRSGTLRPKDMKTRGPLGEAEAKAVLALDRIIESEKIRMERSQLIGDTVRPIDVPGPLGELEKCVGDIIRAEKQRVKDREKNDGKLVRPKDASMRSGLGDVEQKAVEDWEKLAAEEKERLVSFKRFLAERRPADVLPTSPLGILESFIVKLINGPRLVRKTLDRVQELLNSSTFDEKENAILQRRFEEIQEKDSQGATDDDFGRDMDTDERIRP